MKIKKLTLAQRQKKIRELEAVHKKVNAELNSLRAEQHTDIGDLNVNRMRKASGELTDERLLVGFLYMLMRDVATPGQIERIMLQLSNSHDFHTGTSEPLDLTNGWLGMYAQDVAERLIFNAITWKKPL